MKVHKASAGFSLPALIFFMTAASIFIAAAVPVYQMQAKRELEEELIFRGGEYTRAIQKYQRKFGVYPNSVDQLVSTNGLRFLRRAYKDPITGKDFRLILINPDGSLTGSKVFTQNMNTQSLFGNAQPFGQSNPPPPQQQQQALQQNGQQGLQGQQPFQNSQTLQQSQSSFGQSQSQQSQQPFGASRVGGGIAPAGGLGGFTQSQQSQPQRGAQQGFGSTPGTAGGQPIAGGGIVGVASDSNKDSIKIYNNRQKYDEWDFVAILGQQGQQGQGAQQPNTQQNPLGNGQRQTNPFQTPSTSPFGGAPTASPFGTNQTPSTNPFGGGTTQPLNQPK